MQINIKAKDVRNENGKFIIEIDSDTVGKILGLSKEKLSEVKPGQIIKGMTDIEYIVLEHFDNGTTKVIRKELLPERKVFDDKDNNFATSSIKKELNDDYYKTEVIPGFGEDNVVPHEINLLSLDGFDDYGKCTVNVGLLTIDDYRKYHKDCLKENMESYWWLSTPDSTPSGAGGGCVRCVDGGGCVSCRGCRWGKGVRPDFFLKSSIFVSVVEE